MSTYRPLGSRTVTASADSTGNNSGNLTCSFPQSVLTVKVPFFEVYHISITGVPAGAVATITINNITFAFTAPGLAGSATAGAGTDIEYEAGMLLGPGDEVDFLWSVSSSTTPAPVVTLWLRYDLDANKGLM